MNNYELLYILPASETSEEIVKNFQDVQKNIEKFGGKMLETLLDHPFLTKAGMSKEEEPDELKAITIVKRKLAYPIKHEKFGFYCLVNFEAEPKKLVEIDEYLRLNSKVLRHILIQADPMTKDQLALLETLFARKKSEQDKEEAERKTSETKEEPKRIFKKEVEEKAAEPAGAEDKEATAMGEEVEEVEVKEESVEKVEAKEEVKTEVPEEKEVKAEAETVKEKKTEKAKKEDTDKKDEKKPGRKSKIKLEELEDKLDEILEDTIV